LDDVPLGEQRLVPLPLEEFEAAIRAAGGRSTEAEPPRLPLLEESFYEAVLTADGRLDGRLSFDVGAAEAPRRVALGMLPVERVDVEAEGQVSEGLLFGVSAEGLQAIVARPGRASLPWVLRSEGDPPRFTIPLVPALHSSLELTLPTGVVPLVEGNDWTRQGVQIAPAAPASPTTRWRIDAGPVRRITISLHGERDADPRVACWQNVLVGAGQLRLSATIVPRGPWRRRTLFLEADPRLRIESVAAMGTGRAMASGDIAWRREEASIDIALPEACLGTMMPLAIQAVAPLPTTTSVPHAPADPAVREDWLPLMGLPAAEWGGGGVRVECEPGSSFADVVMEQGVAVVDGRTAAWPLVGVGRGATGGESPSSPAATETTRDRAVLAVEAQSPGLRLRVDVVPGNAEIDVARVTEVDVAPARIVGRMTCELLVRRGTAFDISGRIAPGWFIDSVETMERCADGSLVSDTADELSKPEWRVIGDRQDDRLRIGFPTAATPQRGLLLRIVGHRAGVATGERFSCSEMDMVRLEGEADGMAVLALTSSAETTIQIDRPASPPATPAGRLVGLTGMAALRAWIPVDGPSLGATASLLERRPAVAADTRIRLTVRDDRLTESFTFSCRPEDSALDAVVVHFSEPTDDLLDWALLPPAGSSLSVRRIDSTVDRVGAGPGGESWLIEFQPPLREEVGIRATRVLPFTAPVAVPLAWVEGSARQTGEVVVINGGRRRPLVVNRRLEELPPLIRAGDEDLPKGTLAEFAYTPEIGGTPAVTPAAELVPGGRDRDEDARAWVWNEETTCWCHPTGVTEYETCFEIENHGRTSVALTPPVALVPRGVVIDGVPVTVSSEIATGSLLVDLPTDRRFVRLVVRAEMERPTGNGLWRVDLAATGIDMPVLERTWQVLLAGGVDIAAIPAGLQDIGPARPGWLERLLPVTIRRRATVAVGGGPVLSRQGTVDAGFRERSFMALFRRGQDAGLLLVHSRWLWGAALAVFLTFLALGFAVRRRLPRLLAGVGLALVALWVPLPLDAFARAGLCGLAAAAIVRWFVGQWRPSATLAALAMAGCLGSGPALANAGEPAGERVLEPGPSAGSLPVFIVPGSPSKGPSSRAEEGQQTALVPEPLFRTLMAATGRDAAAHVRILAARIVARPGAPIPWTLQLDVDADAGGLLTLRQNADATWGSSPPSIDDVPAVTTADSDNRLLRIAFPQAGRHRLRAGLVVRPSRRGELETALVDIPFAPRAVTVVEGAFAAPRGTAAVLQLDALDAEGRPSRAPRADQEGGDGAAFDVSRASRIRLAWAADGRTRIIDAAPTVESRNEITWEEGGCRLAASYAIDPGDQLVRGVVVRASPRLGDITVTDPAWTTTPLGGGRFLLEPTSPRRGRLSLAVAFTMPLADPSGFFDLPEAWLESTAADGRTTTLTPTADFAIKATLPDDAIPLTPRGNDAAAVGWRTETGRRGRPVDGEPGGNGPVAAPGRGPSTTVARIAVERRRQVPRGSQRVDLDLADDHARIRLQARIDTAATPLVVIPIEVPPGCEVERLMLREERAASLPAPDKGDVDVRWRYESPGRVVAVVQQPRTGTFTLGVVARMPGAPSAIGRLPVIRVLDLGGAVTVTWRVAEGKAAIVTAGSLPDGPDPLAKQTGSIEIAADAVSPGYKLVDSSEDPSAVRSEVADGAGDGDAAGEGEPRPDEVAAWGESRVEFAETRLAIDSRARAWGVSRFDLVAADPLIRIQLPAGMRLFDVFIDGRVVNDAVPARSTIADNAWEVRLLDVGWPRSIVAVFHGELLERLPVDGVLDIPAPSIVGLPCRRSAWILELPEGVSARSLGPAVEVGAETLLRERQSALEALVPEFEWAIERASSVDARRLEDFLSQRRREAVLPLPPAWSHVGARDRIAAAAWAPPLRLIQGEDQTPLKLSIVRRPDATMPGRALATAAILAGVVALLEARRRTPVVSRLAGVLASAWWAAPGLAVLGGGAWIAAVDPAWPGWLSALAGGAALVAWAPRAIRPPLARRDGLLAGRRFESGNSSTLLLPVPASPADAWRHSAGPRQPRDPHGGESPPGSTARPGR